MASRKKGSMSDVFQLDTISMSLTDIIRILNEIKQSKLNKKAEIQNEFGRINACLNDHGIDMVDVYGEEMTRIAIDTLSKLRKTITSVAENIPDVYAQNETIFMKYNEWLIVLQDLLIPFVTPAKKEPKWTCEDYTSVINHLQESSQNFLKNILKGMSNHFYNQTKNE